MTLAAAHHPVPREPAWASLWRGFLLSVAPPVALVAFELCQALGLAPQTDAGVAVACIIAAAISGLGAIRFVSGLRAARRVDRDRVTLVARQSEALEEAR